MIVAVTGASGHVGGNLVRALLAAGRTVRALVYDDDRALQGLDVEVLEGDVCDAEALVPLFDGVDVVFHLAARISVVAGDDDALQAINVQGTRNVMQACLHAGVRRVVHFSSIHALADVPKGRPINEECELALGDDHLGYDRSKAGGERVVAEFVAKGLDVVTVNPGAILGRHDHGPSAMGEVLLDLYHRRMPALIDGGFGWVDVRDVVDAAIAAEGEGKTGERYLVVGRWASFRELATMVEQHTGRKAPRIVSPVWVAQLAAPLITQWAKIVGKRPLYTPQSVQIVQHHRNIDCGKARAELGFDPRPLEETVADAFAWFEQNQNLA